MKAKLYGCVFCLLVLPAFAFGQPDIKVPSIGVSPQTSYLEADFSYTASIQVTNGGLSAAGSFHLKVNFWGKIYGTTVSGLDAGESVTIDFISEPFTPVCNLLYGIVATADDLGQVVESNESNNTKTGGFLRGACPGSPTSTPDNTDQHVHTNSDAD